MCVQSLSLVWLFDPMDCSPPSSSVCGISQARILKWVAISFSRGSSWTRDQNCVSWVFFIGRSSLYCLSHWGSPRMDICIFFISKNNISWGKYPRACVISHSGFTFSFFQIGSCVTLFIEESAVFLLIWNVYFILCYIPILSGSIQILCHRYLCLISIFDYLC